MEDEIVTHSWTHTYTPLLSLLSEYVYLLSSNNVLSLSLCYHTATNGKNGISFLSLGFFSSSFFSQNVSVCYRWHSNSGRQMAISLPPTMLNIA